MILIGIGSNLEGPWGPPAETVRRAISALGAAPLSLRRVSRPIVTLPFGRTDQPDFVNAVAWIETGLEPEALMQHLHALERAAGRRRTVRWGPRTLDLDLLDYEGIVLSAEGEQAAGGSTLLLPHPGIADRPFVLKPIAEIAPAWRHPVLDRTAVELLQQLGKMPEGDERGQP